MKFKNKLLATLAISATALSVAQAGTLYIGTWNDRTVYEVDLNAQTTTALAGGFGLVTGMEGIGQDLYVFDQSNDSVTQLDPDNGSVLNTYSLSALGVNVTGEGTFAMHSDMTGFVSSSSGGTGTYWTFDLIAGTATMLGTGVSFDGVDYAPNGTLYGLTQSYSASAPHQLHTIDPVTGATTLIGSTGIIGDALAALVVADGDFIAGMGSSLYRIDPNTAQATLLFNPGLGPISGAAYLGSTNPGGGGNVPVPAPLALIGLGLAAVGLQRRKRG